MFEVGDIIRGISDNYSITNTHMSKARVIKVNPPYNMKIEILEHDFYEEGIGKSFTVDFDTREFEFVEDYSTFFIEHGSDQNG